MIKSARNYNAIRNTRDGRVRDAVRERDAASINEAVLTIVADGAERMGQMRGKGQPITSSSVSLDDVVEVVDWGVRTFGSYVGWIDINLTVTPTTVPLLFTLLADPSLPIRLATSVALLRIVCKGLKEPGDKLQLIKVLSLGQVIEALEAKTRLGRSAESADDGDEGEESYREALGKLLNAFGLELAKLAEVRVLFSELWAIVNTMREGRHERRDLLRGNSNVETNIACDASIHGRRIRRYMLDRVSPSFEHSLECRFLSLHALSYLDMAILVQEKQKDVL